MLLHSLLSCLGLSVVRDVGSCGVESSAEVIDPDARLGAQQEVGRHEPNFGKFFFEIFVDDRRLVNNPLAVD